MTNKLENGRFEPAPVALLITLALVGVSPSLHARDYFNPVFLSVDNPEMAGTDLSNFEEGARSGEISC